MVLELNAPPANTYSYEMIRKLDAHVPEARTDFAVHVVVVTSTGAGQELYCAGGDIKMLQRADLYFKYGSAP